MPLTALMALLSLMRPPRKAEAERGIYSAETSLTMGASLRTASAFNFP